MSSEIGESMDIKKRRAIASSLGRVDLGEIPEKKVLRVEDPEDRPDEENIHRRHKEPEYHPAGYSEAVNKLDEIKELERMMEEDKLVKKEERASQSAVQILEILTGIGRLTQNVEIENIKFSIRSLKNKEMREILEKGLDAKTRFEEALLVRNYTLAYSIYKINDQPAELFMRTEDIDEKVALIDEMQSSIVSKLWEEYSKMLQSHNDSLKTGLGETPKEISENIKKS